MESSVNRQPGLAVPSSADWLRLRPIFTELYLDRRCSMAQVRDHLKSLGYWANTRMIRARISQWSLQRNNQLHDMVSALRLLDPDPALWPTPEPWFLIRGRQVAMSEVLRFFRRKGIRNPIQWCRSAVIDRDAPAVTLIHERISPVDGTSEDSLTLGALSSTHSSVMPAAFLSMSRQTSPVNIYAPILTVEQRAVGSLRDYCAVYLGLGIAAIHQEPPVHQFTTHGRFGDRMQEGLAQMMRRGPGAFPNFRRAFDLVQPLLSDCHPMSIAQLLAIACELSAKSQAQAVLRCLLRYLAAMAMSLHASPPLVQFFLSLSSSPPALLQQTAVSSLRAALGIFSEQSPHSWHRLYIQERLCDCLYHGQDRTEGGARRAQLLTEQETFYGPLARNVLWTATNVADDFLDGSNLDGAEGCYMMVLMRAEHLSGFPRAKMRYAALEGLGRVHLARVDRLPYSNSANVSQDIYGLNLRKAYHYVEQALNEALTWFEQPSRRVARVREQEEYIRNLLQSYSYIPSL